MRVLSFVKKARRNRRESRSPGKVDDSRLSVSLSTQHLLEKAPQESPPENHDLWLMAEQRLKEDTNLERILAAATEILEAEFNFRASTTASTTCVQLCRFLDIQTHELEEKKWVVKLGQHSIKVEDQLTRTFRNMLMMKDVINTATAASPPAALACAGVMICLKVKTTSSRKLLSFVFPENSVARRASC